MKEYVQQALKTAMTNMRMMAQTYLQEEIASSSVLFDECFRIFVFSSLTTMSHLVDVLASCSISVLG